MRNRAGREASPTAAVVDSQSVKTAESGGVPGDDAGQKTGGRTRHATSTPIAGDSSGTPPRRTFRTAMALTACCGPLARAGHSCDRPM